MPRGSGSDDNCANQMNRNNDGYWQSRGYDEHPDDWEYLTDEDEASDHDNRANQLNPIVMLTGRLGGPLDQIRGM